MDAVHDAVMTDVGFITVYATAETMSGSVRSQRRTGSAMETAAVLATGR
jgi:hypothetical protein